MAYNEKDVNISFRVSRELRDKMHLRAKQLDMNVSQFFRNCMENEIMKDDIPVSNSLSVKDTANNQMKPVTFFCPSNLYDSFIQTCAKQNIAKAIVLRKFVADYIKDNL